MYAPVGHLGVSNGAPSTVLPYAGESVSFHLEEKALNMIGGYTSLSQCQGANYYFLKVLRNLIDLNCIT